MTSTTPEITLTEETIYTGHLLNLSVREAQLASGQTVQREVVITRGAVVIVPITDQQEVRLVRQYRVAADKWLIELPAGTLEVDENPDEAAPRELLEETGDQAGTWHKLGGFYTVPGILTEYLHLYLATDLTPGANRPEFDEHIEVLTLPWLEAIAMMKTGQIEDAKTMAGLIMAGLQLGLQFDKARAVI